MTNARTLTALAAMIKDDLADGKHAADEASFPYYVRGRLDQLMEEANDLVKVFRKHGEIKRRAKSEAQHEARP
jgi:hypothetical protein